MFSKFAIRTAVLVGSLSLFFCLPHGLAQTVNDWQVYERFLPPPVSRMDYVMVGRPLDATEGWRMVPLAPRTFAQAVAFADSYRLGYRFKSVCDKSYSVYRNPDTNQFSVSREAVPSRLLVKAWMCCEDAFELAFPTPGSTAATNDCRTTTISSLPGLPMARWTSSGLFWAGTNIEVDPDRLVAPSLGGRDPRFGVCSSKGRTNQTETRDGFGRIRTEAATIHILDCPGRGEVYIYEYTNRRGFRAIKPPNWGAALGGRDFETMELAVQAASDGDKPDKAPNPYDRYRAFWGTWRGTKVASGITIVLRPDGTGTYNDIRPGYERNISDGRWAAADTSGCVVAVAFRLCLQSNGTALDPWGNVYSK